MKSILLFSASIAASVCVLLSTTQAAPAQPDVVGPGQITSLSALSADRSGYLEINGTNFGTTGTTLIGGLAAPIADWQNTKIVAYVPEAAALGASSVQVVNDSGTPSSSVSLSVTPRTPNGKVKWRFRQDGPYSQVRPVIGPDGTIYSIDVYDHLYALTPDGGLKWIVRGAPAKGVAVGTDSTIYTASEAAVTAYNSDGTQKWTYPMNPYAFNVPGISVGPDGNIYSVAVEGIGAFSLTPQGTLRWSKPEPYDAQAPIPYNEIVFGPNGTTSQMYFYQNSHLKAYKLDGSLAFTINSDFGQPAVGPEGNIHTAFGAYLPTNGKLAWVFVSDFPYNTTSAPDVGSDGIHYEIQNTLQLFALTSTGAKKWQVTLDGTFGDPVVDPQNTQIIAGSKQMLFDPGYIIAASAADGHELWRVNLPAENGFNQATDTKARFSPDGLSAYLIAFTATGNNDTSESFLYALDTNASTTQPVLRSTNIAAQAKTSGSGVKAQGRVTVQDGNGAAVAGATVAITWKVPSGATISQSATTNAKGLASFTTSDVAGSYTLTVTNITKTGYTFDTANSILTKTIRSR
ncbi:MAG TPA: PQQ-binding-like beta-propeller repeat protein [Chthoniobacterales bacterium]